MHLTAHSRVPCSLTSGHSTSVGSTSSAPGAFRAWRGASRRLRRSWVAASTGADASQDRPVFKLTGKGPEMSLADIRDAYEVCSLIPSPNERSQCYSCWGIDAERMADYYDFVLGLEKSLEGAAAGAATADPDEFQSAYTSMAE